ncbi:Wzz/FepE/Etk N-terminal domain-containing protein [Lactobacillus delbrueckii subsp. bulgaricus]|uniref:Capsular polysaccharide biosynthesis protein CpsC n=2 Tax=Lactobacillus delbrueckii subsp. bulgaricus TaxID=1585 RepID=Q9F0C6_LACDE|nr:Wzz/FepE/Etk N-terminal domain-containing protein [Lactobacillus delbrueckii]AAG44706.1 EpsB [Lactobacillus delbrueckii subsp. bulgaricus]MCD5461917.1 Wzz/FepE/Etk N-terminal domain-containing protein [Lactobacillus delbrueckii subsp. bulgaricus]MCD5477315.1 Wzz/FepE/Etk N-terminal domain-containing protein [Lactobacillus delbrueckii subsp. bulgaricus]MCT3477493.1 exopolysaccharide biosynthesis protein [Lactobacillus delbrueckii subsp. bulgaricus]MCT3479230.1 exopolysaccharide biosynthesis 
MSAEQQNNEEVTIDLRRLFILIRKHIISILIWMIGLGLIAYGVSEYVLVPKYTASTQLLVNRKTADANHADANQAYANQQADINAVTTYKDIITSNVILKGASKYLANPVTLVKKATPAKKAVYKTNDGTRTLVKKAVKAKPAVYKRESKSYSVSANELASAVSVTTTTSSQVFTLSATAETPAKAQAIANAVAKEFKEQIPKIMDVNNVTIVAEAAKGTKSYPNVKMITMVGVLAGLVISLLIIIIKDLSDTTVREDSFMTNELGLTNLGEIAHITMPKDWTFTAKTAEKRGSSRRRV